MAVSGGAVLADQGAHPAPGELDARVPELDAFHKVIYELWHHAWPNDDYETMVELLPDVREGVANLAAADLPGILRDKADVWQSGIDRLKATLAEYESAASASDPGPALKKAVEDLHSRFEQLVRIVHPVMDELEAYHQVLYGIYHYYGPEKNLETLRGSAGELVEACAKLESTEIPKRFASRSDALKPEFASLCALSAQLETAAAGDDWSAIEPAIEHVHSQYQKVESTFE
jgi:hypothetical protein